LGRDDTLEPLPSKIAGKFNLWLGREQRAGRSYTDEQLVWLNAVRDHLAVNAEATVRDLQEVPAFGDKGGIVRARALFGARLNEILDDLSDALVA
jgi:type I restriction enzyme, R subunit